MKMSRWWFILVVVVGVAAAILWPRSADLLALGSAANAEARLSAPASIPGASARGVAERHAFDYFPDHYINEAREPAEPIDPF